MKTTNANLNPAKRLHGTTDWSSIYLLFASFLEYLQIKNEQRHKTQQNHTFLSECVLHLDSCDPE